ncbi:hypothetical protein Gogos_001963, partial [Gossypium gossypioides]|nr:hypothetical protein [Gossypium gossypioides]
SGFVPIFIYAIFGSSRQISIGPAALTSLLVSNVLGKIVDSSDALYTELAIVLTLMVGILECIMGLLRLGWLIRFISHSVISGFTTASAIVIGLSQAKYFLGYEIDRSSEIVPIIKSIISGADKGKSRKHLKFLQAMGPPTAVILGTSSAKIYHPSSITLVGDIPQGLPSFSIPKGFKHAKSLIPTTLVITGIRWNCQSIGSKNGYELDSNQELFGLGAANVLGSFFSAYPTTGSFSRSAVNHENGAKTGLAGVITGIVMCCALLFLTPVFEYIPLHLEELLLGMLTMGPLQCALAAIVISAVISLVDYEEAIFLWRVGKKDFLLWTITAITTLFFGIEIGVLIGPILISVSGCHLFHTSFQDSYPSPSNMYHFSTGTAAVLGRLPGTTVYRNIQQYPEAYTYNGIFEKTLLSVRLREYEIAVDKLTRRGPRVGRIYFVVLEMSRKYISFQQQYSSRSKIHNCMSQLNYFWSRERAVSYKKNVAFDSTAAVTYIDTSAVQALKELHHEYKSRHIQIAISNPNRNVLLMLSKSGVVELIGKEWYFVRVHDAVQVCLQHVESIKEDHMASGSDSSPEETESSFFKSLLKQRGEDSSVAELESGTNNKPSDLKHSDPLSEPLLFKKS